MFNSLQRVVSQDENEHNNNNNTNHQSSNSHGVIVNEPQSEQPSEEVKMEIQQTEGNETSQSQSPPLKVPILVVHHSHSRKAHQHQRGPSNDINNSNINNEDDYYHGDIHSSSSTLSDDVSTSSTIHEEVPAFKDEEGGYEKDIPTSTTTPAMFTSTTGSTSIPTAGQPTLLRRMDSPLHDSSSGSFRASSHNSSRDWGWFEDVHQPPPGVMSSTKETAPSLPTNRHHHHPQYRMLDDNLDNSLGMY
jgi:hypothetical protein